MPRLVRAAKAAAVTGAVAVGGWALIIAPRLYPLRSPTPWRGSSAMDDLSPLDEFLLRCSIALAMRDAAVWQRAQFDARLQHVLRDVEQQRVFVRCGAHRLLFQALGAAALPGSPSYTHVHEQRHADAVRAALLELLSSRDAAVRSHVLNSMSPRHWLQLAAASAVTGSTAHATHNRAPDASTHGEHNVLRLGARTRCGQGGVCGENSSAAAHSAMTPLAAAVAAQGSNPAHVCTLDVPAAAAAAAALWDVCGAGVSASTPAALHALGAAVQAAGSDSVAMRHGTLALRTWILHQACTSMTSMAGVAQAAPASVSGPPSQGSHHRVGSVDVRVWPTAARAAILHAMDSLATMPVTTAEACSATGVAAHVSPAAWLAIALACAAAAAPASAPRAEALRSAAHALHIATASSDATQLSSADRVGAPADLTTEQAPHSAPTRAETWAADSTEWLIAAAPLMGQLAAQCVSFDVDDRAPATNTTNTATARACAALLVASCATAAAAAAGERVANAQLHVPHAVRAPVHGYVAKDESVQWSRAHEWSAAVCQRGTAAGVANLSAAFLSVAPAALPVHAPSTADAPTPTEPSVVPRAPDAVEEAARAPSRSMSKDERSAWQAFKAATSALVGDALSKRARTAGESGGQDESEVAALRRAAFYTVDEVLESVHAELFMLEDELGMFTHGNGKRDAQKRSFYPPAAVRRQLDAQYAPVLQPALQRSHDGGVRLPTLSAQGEVTYASPSLAEAATACVLSTDDATCAAGVAALSQLVLSDSMTPAARDQVAQSWCVAALTGAASADVVAAGGSSLRAASVARELNRWFERHHKARAFASSSTMRELWYEEAEFERLPPYVLRRLLAASSRDAGAGKLAPWFSGLHYSTGSTSPALQVHVLKAAAYLASVAPQDDAARRVLARADVLVPAAHLASRHTDAALSRVSRFSALHNAHAAMFSELLLTQLSLSYKERVAVLRQVARLSANLSAAAAAHGMPTPSQLAASSAHAPAWTLALPTALRGMAVLWASPTLGDAKLRAQALRLLTNAQWLPDLPPTPAMLAA
ncbi:hypothetical protein EON68_00250, partial [archaeon]